MNWKGFTLKGLYKNLTSRVSGRFNRGIWVITLFELITAAGFSTCVPFLSLYLYQERGVSMTLIGLAFLIGGLLSAASQMVGGILSDRFGRKKLIVFSMTMNVIAYSAMAVLIGVDAPVTVILTVYILGRVAGMTSRPAVSAMVVDLSDKEHLTETYGLLRVGRNVGWGAGPALGGFLASFLSYSWLFAVAVMLNAIGILMIVVMLKESWNSPIEKIDFKGSLSVITNKSFLVFTFLCFLVFLSMAHFGTTLSVFSVDRMGFSTTEYGLLLTINGAIVVLFQYPVVFGLSKIRHSSALVIGGLLYGIGYLVMSQASLYYLAIISMCIVTIGEIIFSPVATAVVGELAPTRHRGRYMGFFGWSETIGVSFAPLVGGYLLDNLTSGAGLVWLPIAGFGFLASIGFLFWGRKSRSVT